MWIPIKLIYYLFDHISCQTFALGSDFNKIMEEDTSQFREGIDIFLGSLNLILNLMNLYKTQLHTECN